MNKTNKSGVYSTLLFEGCRVNGFRVATVGRFDCSHICFGLRGDRACSCHAAGRGGGCSSVFSSGEKLAVPVLGVKYVPTHVSTVIHVVVSTMCRLMCQRSSGCSKRTWCQLCPDAGHHTHRQPEAPRYRPCDASGLLLALRCLGTACASHVSWPESDRLYGL